MAEEKELFDNEIVTIEMEGPDGQEIFIQEMIIPYNGKEFAVLVKEGVDEDAILTRIDVDENGEEIYVSPEDDEFEAVEKLYEEFFAEDK